MLFKPILKEGHLILTLLQLSIHKFHREVLPENTIHCNPESISDYDHNSSQLSFDFFFLEIRTQAIMLLTAEDLILLSLTNVKSALPRSFFFLKM